MDEGNKPKHPTGGLLVELRRTLASGRAFALVLLDLLRPLLHHERRVLVLLCGLAHIGMEWVNTALDVHLSFLQRSYMSALQAGQRTAFERGLAFWIVGTVLSGWTSLCKDTLRIQVALLWHRALLHEMLTVCFEQRGFLRVRAGLPLDNADQSIAVVSRELVNQVMQAFVILNASLSSVVQYARILWRIRPVLLLALVANGTIGVSVALRNFAGWLYRVTNAELNEAGSFRRSLVRAELRAEDIALCGAEPVERLFVDEQIASWFRARWASLLATRTREAWNTLYGETLHAIPLILASSAFFAKKVDFGAISQAVQAFRTVHINSTGLISSRLVLWATLSVNATRVRSVLGAAAPDATDTDGPCGRCVEDLICKEAALECEDLDIAAGVLEEPRTLLIKGLNLRVCRREALLVVGPSGCGKTSLLRTLAGVWQPARGAVHRAAASVAFMPQRPLMAPRGSLLQQVLYPWPEAADSTTALRALRREGADAVLEAVLAAGLDTVVKRLREGACGGGNKQDLRPEELASLGSGNWAELLSPGEQQRVAFARTFVQRPALALLDEATSALDLALEARLYARLQQMDTTVISIAHRPSLLRFHTHVLEIRPCGPGTAGHWRLCPVEDCGWRASSEAERV